MSSAALAESFYCGLLGFRRQFAYRSDESSEDPCYMGVERDGACLHLSSFSGDGVPGSVVYLSVEDVDSVHEALRVTNTLITLEPTDQNWGNREMYVADPDGNALRFTQELV